MAGLLQCEHGITEIKLSGDLITRANEWLAETNRNKRSILEANLLDWIEHGTSLDPRAPQFSYVKRPKCYLRRATSLQHELRFYLLMVGNHTTFPDDRLAPWEATHSEPRFSTTFKKRRLELAEAALVEGRLHLPKPASPRRWLRHAPKRCLLPPFRSIPVIFPWYVRIVRRVSRQRVAVRNAVEELLEQGPWKLSEKSPAASAVANGVPLLSEFGLKLNFIFARSEQMVAGEF